MKPFVIAIDGPAASGKGTLARNLATHYHLPHLDTGLTYRAVADALLKANELLDNENTAIKIAKSLDFSQLDPDHLSNNEIGEAASKVAVMPGLRETLVAVQRQFAEQTNGAVLDGRDIGTVVCPDASVKLYIVASPEARAERRYREILSKGKTADYDKILADLIQRDERDMNRKQSPLKPAPDAHLLDTTKLSIESAFKAACAVVDTVLAQRGE